MGSSTQKSTSTSGPSNPDLNSLVSKLSKGIGAQYNPTGSLYSAPGTNTTQGLQASLNAANNPAFSGGLAGALSSYGARAAGNELGNNDPGYAALRSRIADDTMSDVNSMFTTSGRFGSGSHVGAASEGLANALAGLDYNQYNNSLNRQSEAANLLPQLFTASQLPASIQQSVGASQDADAAAKLRGGLDYQGAYAGLLGQAAGSSGTTTTNTQPTTPLWQQILGYVAGNAGQAVKVM